MSRPFHRPVEPVVGRCFTCDGQLVRSTLVYFGPGALMKCGSCGGWTSEELERGAKANAAYAKLLKMEAAKLVKAEAVKPQQS